MNKVATLLDITKAQRNKTLRSRFSIFNELAILMQDAKIKINQGFIFKCNKESFIQRRQVCLVGTRYVNFGKLREFPRNWSAI